MHNQIESPLATPAVRLNHELLNAAAQRRRQTTRDSKTEPKMPEIPAQGKHARRSSTPEAGVGGESPFVRDFAQLSAQAHGPPWGGGVVAENRRRGTEAVDHRIEIAVTVEVPLN